jgi:hypothetical protein
MLVTNFKAKISSHSSKSKSKLHREEQPQQWRKGPKRALSCVLGMKDKDRRRKKRRAATFCVVSISPSVHDINRQ